MKPLHPERVGEMTVNEAYPPGTRRENDDGMKLLHPELAEK
jgi:hypothetical protein